MAEISREEQKPFEKGEKEEMQVDFGQDKKNQELFEEDKSSEEVETGETIPNQDEIIMDQEKEIQQQTKADSVLQEQPVNFEED